MFFEKKTVRFWEITLEGCCEHHFCVYYMTLKNFSNPEGTLSSGQLQKCICTVKDTSKLINCISKELCRRGLGNCTALFSDWRQKTWVSQITAGTL